MATEAQAAAKNEATWTATSELGSQLSVQPKQLASLDALGVTSTTPSAATATGAVSLIPASSLASFEIF